MVPDDFFEVVDPAPDDPWPIVRQVAKRELLEQLRERPLPGRTDLDAATALTRLAHQELEAYGTSGGYVMQDNDVSLALRALRAVLYRIGIDLPRLPFRDFSTFNAHWKRQGMANSYQARRDYLDGIFLPLYEKLDRLEERQLSGHLARPVTPRGRLGWTSIDEELEQLRRRFAAATTPQDYNAVGTACVRVLESLGDVVYDPKRHLRDGEVAPTRDKTKQRLGRFVEDAIPGADNAELRSLVNATVALAQTVKHRKTPDRQSAGIAADSVILLANIVRRLTQVPSKAAIQDGSR